LDDLLERLIKGLKPRAIPQKPTVGVEGAVGQGHRT
jgi:hypothetical protein